MNLNLDQFIEALEIDEDVAEEFSEETQRRLFLEYAQREDSNAEERQRLVRDYHAGKPFTGEKGLRRRLAAIDMEYFGRAYLPHYFKRESPEFHSELNAIWQDEVLKGLNPYKHKTAISLSRKAGVRIAISAPRGHAKSTNFTFKDALHATLYKYKHFILILSDSSDQAEGFLSDIKSELEDNPLIFEDFGKLQSSKGWTDSSIRTVTGVRIDAIGSGKKVRGRRNRNWRPDLIILDDVENDENVRTAEQREKLYSWFTRAVEPAGDTYTDIVYIGTVLHYHSLLKRVQAKAAYKSVDYKAVISWSIHPQLWDAWSVIFNNLDNTERMRDARNFFDQNKAKMLEGTQVLWEAKKDYYSLMVEKVNIGDAAFGSEYQNEPLDPSTATFHEEWFEYYNPLDMDFKDPRYQFIIAVDPSLAKTKKSDYSTIVVLVKDTKTGYMYIHSASLEKRIPDQIIEDVLSTERRLRIDYSKGASVIGVESIAFQHFFKDELAKRSVKEGLYLNVEGIENYNDKNLRIKRLQPFVKNGYIKFNAQDKTLLKQMKEHPMSAHDDGPDALEMAVKLAENLSFMNSASSYKTVIKRRFSRIKGAY